MPLYEYRCSGCDCTEEYYERSDFDGVHECPSCGSKEMSRIFSTFATGEGSRGGSGSCTTCSGGTCSTCGGH